jgi:predicted transcriptional regulator
MTTLSLRLPDELLHEVDVFADEMHIPRAAYVRKALEQMNASVAAQRRRTRLMEASLKVRSESMRVNAEFDGIEDAPHA